jgi:glycine cleavage system regulatory protein
VSGSPLFEMTLEVSVPAETRLATVRRDLDELADELNLDLAVTRLSR